MKTTLVLDANCLCWRAFHTTGSLSFGNVGTGVMYGLLRDVRNFTQRFATSRVVFCFDHGPYLRCKLYPKYKANRKPKDKEQEKTLNEVRKQINLLRDKHLKAAGFRNVFHHKGYEADDVIASYLNCNKRVGHYIVVSADQDLLQLIDKDVTFWNPTHHRVITQDSFVRDFDLTAYQWAEVRAMAGCSTDGVPGIKGIGQSTAVKYCNGTLLVKSAAYQKIIAAENDGTIRKMTRLVKLPFKGCPAFKHRNDVCTQEKWRALCARYGMKSLMDRAFGI